MAKVWISQKLIDDMLADVEEYFPLETGGSFFGYTSDSNDVVITHLIDAGPRAKRTKFSFEPDQGFQLPEMELLFYKHKGSVRYLGDWHSHPCSFPGSQVLSPVFCRSARSQINTDCVFQMIQPFALFGNP